MNTRVWAKPGLKWAGFQPVAYGLDHERVANLRVKELEETPNGKKEAETTLGEIFQRIRDALTKKQIESVDTHWDRTEIVTKTGTLVFAGCSFNLTVLDVLLNLRDEIENPSACVWYWYDSDYVTDDPHQGYTFFIGHHDNILRERVMLSDYSSSGFDPSIFVSSGDTRIWSHDRYWEEAHTRYMYQKFYQETPQGRLMVLRPDKPELFHWPEGRWTVQSGSAQIAHELRSMRFLVFLVLLAVVVLVLLRIR